MRESATQKLARLNVVSVAEDANKTTENEAAGRPDAVVATADKVAKISLDVDLRPSTKPKKSKPAPSPAPEILEDFILDSLAYKSMRDREEEVTEAHSKTLQWVFARSPTDGTFRHPFATWLASAGSASEPGLNDARLSSGPSPNGPIYWVSGKPGSGKSTLMRFLFSHPTTTECLESWAGTGVNVVPVSKAGFFFWTSGSKEQRSLAGLLRYLTHQLLSDGRNRGFMGRVFPALWKRLGGMTTKERVSLVVDWDAKDLMRAFRTLVQLATGEGGKICLFVDGLDEFEGDHTDIVRFFRSLGDGAHRDRVKMCLSSRPWEVFERELGTTVPHLKLQELTQQDMHRYVADRLGADARVGACLEASSKPGAGLDIFDEIVHRADGVFIWVRLTVSKILKEFRADGSVEGLMAIVRRLPVDLNALFDTLIFTNRSDLDIEQTAAIFRLITAREGAAAFVNDDTANSLHVWDLALAMDSEDDALVPDAETVVEVRQATDEEIQIRCGNTTTALETRFWGLLGAFPRPQKACKDKDEDDDEDEDTTPAAKARAVGDMKVTYIHRTVRDWLMEGNTPSEAGKRLLAYLSEEFNPHLRLLRSGVLALMMPLERPWKRRWLNDWWPSIVMCATHARLSEVHHEKGNGGEILSTLMRGLDRTLAWYWLPRFGGADSTDHWARHAFGSYEVRMMAPMIREPYLALVAKFGVEGFVRAELERRDRGTPSLAPDQATADGLRREEEGTEVVDGVEDELQGDGDDGDDGDDDDTEPEDTREGTPLLSYATEFLCSRNKTVYPLSSPSFVRYLLEHPSPLSPGPNHEYTNFVPRFQTTPWLSLLRHLRDAHRRGWIEHLDTDPQGTSRWVEVVKMFLEAGADRDAIIKADQFDPEISALGVLRLLEAEYCDAGVSAISMKWASG